MHCAEPDAAACWRLLLLRFLLFFSGVCWRLANCVFAHYRHLLVWSVNHHICHTLLNKFKLNVWTLTSYFLSSSYFFFSVLSFLVLHNIFPLFCWSQPLNQSGLDVSSFDNNFTLGHTCINLNPYIHLLAYHLSCVKSFCLFKCLDSSLNSLVINLNLNILMTFMV